MPEQLQNILEKVTEWWKKYSTKQKILLVSLTACVMLALVILAVVMTRPQYVPLYDAQNYKEASAVKELLDGNGEIDYQIDNTTHFQVNKKDESKANMLLGANNYATNGYDLSNADLSSVFEGGFSATVADKEKRYKEYLEKIF